MEKQDDKCALFLRDLGAVLKERALAARKQRDADQTDFQRGRLIAYYEVLSTMRNQAGAFEISVQDLNLHDVDLDRDLLSTEA